MFGRFILISSISICANVVFRRRTPGVSVSLTRSDQGKAKSLKDLIFIRIISLLCWMLRKPLNQFLNLCTTDISLLWVFCLFSVGFLSVLLIFSHLKSAAAASHIVTTINICTHFERSLGLRDPPSWEPASRIIFIDSSFSITQGLKSQRSWAWFHICNLYLLKFLPSHFYSKALFPVRAKRKGLLVQMRKSENGFLSKSSEMTTTFSCIYNFISFYSALLPFGSNEKIFKEKLCWRC